MYLASVLAETKRAVPHYFASRRLTQSTVLNSSFIELSLGVVAFKIQWCLTVLLTSKS